MLKQKHGKDMFSIGFTKTQPKKSVKQVNIFLYIKSFFKLVYINSNSCNYKQLSGGTQNL